MRRIWLVAMTCLVLAGCGKGATTVKVADRADRKPGLWEQTVVYEGGRQTTRHCLGEGVTSSFGAAITEGAKSCTPLKMTGTAHGFAFETACDYGENGKSAAHGTISGDPGSSYRMEVTTTVTSAAAPQMN